MQISYRVRAGGWSVDSATDPRTELLELEVHRALGSPADRCRLLLFAPPPPARPLAEALAAAAAGFEALTGGGGAGPAVPPLAVRGVDVAPGDPVSVELTAGDVSATVLRAAVHELEVSPTTVAVTARSCAQRLVDARLDVVHENRTTGSVVADVCSRLDVPTGDVLTGRSWPYLVLDSSRSVWRHLSALAAREGAHLLVDDEDRLCLRTVPGAAPRTHALHHGIDLLDVRLRRSAVGVRSVHVHGESPASSRGTSAWPLLVKDAAPLGGTAGEGDAVRHRRDGALRTKDAADGAALAWLAAASDAATVGEALLPGRPDVRPGDAVEVLSAPRDDVRGRWTVTSVVHRLGRGTGFTTTLGLTGAGGAAGVEGLLDAVPAAVRGVFGA